MIKSEPRTTMLGYNMLTNSIVDHMPNLKIVELTEISHPAPSGEVKARTSDVSGGIKVMLARSG